MQRRLTTILAADVVGFSRLAASDEEGTVSRLRALHHELIDPVIATHRGRTFKTTGDGRLIEFASVVDAVRGALEVQRGMALRNQKIMPENRIDFRVGIHVGDVIVEQDGDLLGDGVNIAARLEGIAEPGGICISSAAYEQVRDKIAADFADLGERELKNIPRPVRVFFISPASLHSSPSPPEGGEGRVRGPAPGQLTAPSGTVGAGPSLSPLKDGEGNPSPPRLSIVVLPFANIGGDAAHEYFVDGVTESLTTDLSRIRGSFVIARNTAFTYKGKSVDVKAIGRDLNVRYVLEGSVQKGGNRMRVNVQLIEADSGAHLRAERFDKPLADLFDMQDEIVARLANQLSAEMVAAEARRAEGNANVDALDLYFQGMAWRNKGQSPENLGRAGELFERALALDPDSIQALIGKAHVELAVGASLYSDDRAQRLAAGTDALRKVLSRAPDHAVAHVLLGIADIYTNRQQAGIAEFQRALALDPNSAGAYAFVGMAKLYLGHGEETEAYTRDALRLSPRDPYAFMWNGSVAVAKLALGADEEAVDWARRSIEANPNYSIPHLLLAAALAHLGREAESRTAARAGLALDPDFTIRRYRAGAPTDNPIYLAQRERILAGFLKAGVPEG